MLGGRRTTPLFDLLTKHEPAATPAAPVRNPPPVPEIMPAKPVLRIELKPREVQRTEAAPAPQPEPTPEPVVRVHTNAVYITVAVVLTLMVVAIAVGWQMGKSRQSQNDEPFMRRPAPTLTEPGADASEVARAPTAPAPGATQTPPQAAGPADPREKGLNYLYLAVLNQTEAERAGKFLRDNGVEAYAVSWVDPGGGKANNADPLYRLFVKPGIPSGEMKKTTAQNLLTRVLELGGKWQKENRGTSNFTKYSWEKYQ